VLPAYIALPWPGETPPPKIELYACVVLAGAGIILLPVLLGAAIFKFGNLANDGIKLGRHLSACSRDPPSSFLTSNPDTSKWIAILTAFYLYLAVYRPIYPRRTCLVMLPV